MKINNIAIYVCFYSYKKPFASVYVKINAARIFFEPPEGSFFFFKVFWNKKKCCAVRE